MQKIFSYYKNIRKSEKKLRKRMYVYFKIIDFLKDVKMLTIMSVSIMVHLFALIPV